MKLAAHRGATSAAPENTLAAIARAFESGADGVEVDVRLSRDGVPVLIHDADLRRTHGAALRVADATAAELSIHGVPALAEGWAAIPPGRTLWLDLKLPAAAVAGALAGAPPAVALQAFHLDVVAAARAARPDLAVHWLVSAPRHPVTRACQPIPPSAVATAAAAGAAGLAADHRGVTPELVAATRAAGLDLYLWTFPSRDAALACPLDVLWVEADL
ncbi:MAG TPA: glycerophosphodiester phosphodiesterase [Kofleriaceae bacterium]|nr:glycerophosphodiester phosphodiesterase [Kofleriaceae bacterium]